MIEIVAILVGMIILYGIIFAILIGGFPPNPASIVGFIIGSWKAFTHWLVAVSALTALGFILFILSIDIVTPPWIFGSESLFAIPLGLAISNLTPLSTGWSYGIAYGIIFVLAVLYILLYIFVIRKLGK